MAHDLRLLHDRFTELSKSFIAGTMTRSQYLEKTKDLQAYLQKNGIPFEEFTKLG